MAAQLGSLCLLALLVLASAPARAQPILHSRAARTDAVSAEPKPDDEELTANVVRRNFEASYIAHPIGLSGLPPLFLEADIAPHFVVTQRGWPLAFVLTPKILVRMFRERSTPVLTPSYMPRISIYAWLTQRLRRDETSVYASLTLSHHSNGQKGATRLDDGTNDHERGDFSTNYLELAVYETRLSRALFAWNTLAFEWHLDFNRSAGLEGRYGLLRLKLATTVLKTYAPLDGALTAQLGVILDELQEASGSALPRGLERFPLAVQYTVKVPGIDLGVYLGYYLGHDYYNIWFDRVIHTLQVGIAGSVGPVLFGPQP